MPGPVITDSDVTLLKAGVVAGSNKASVTPWAGVALASYGGAADLWGAAWTPGDINAANFGVQVSAGCVGGSASAQIDYVQITITYSIGDTIHKMMMMGIGG